MTYYETTELIRAQSFIETAVELLESAGACDLTMDLRRVLNDVEQAIAASVADAL